MDNSEILQAVIEQLDLPAQLACTLVSRRWYHCAKTYIDSFYLKRPDSTGLERQAHTLRFLHLDRSVPSLIPALCSGQLSRLTTLLISPVARLTVAPSIANLQYGDNTLADMLVKLPLLANLTINGQDIGFARCRPRGMGTQPPTFGGIDDALVALATSRTERGLPGLRSLSITASPNISDYGLITYLTMTATVPGQIAPEHASCGHSLLRVTLIGCPRLTSATLEAIARSCPQLKSCTLNILQGIFQAEGIGQDRNLYASSPADALSEFAQRCKFLHTLSISIGDAQLPSSAFDSFTNHPSLRRLSLIGSEHFSRRQLSSFNTLQCLTIIACPALGTELPFASLPALRGVTYLGQGLSIGNFWELLAHCEYIQRISIDVAECYGRIFEDSGIELGISAQSTLPEALIPFASCNILSAQLPSWALAYILSFAPPTLEAVSLNGTATEVEHGAYSTAPAFGTWWMEQRKRTYAQYYGYGGHGSYTAAILWFFGIILPQHSSTWWSFVWPFVRNVFGRSDEDAARKDSSALESPVDGARTSVPTLPLKVQSGPRSRLTGASILSMPGSAGQSVSPAPHSATFGARPHGCSLRAAAPLNEAQDKLADLLKLPYPDPMYQQAHKRRSRLSPEQTEWLHRETRGQFARLDV